MDPPSEFAWEDHHIRLFPQWKSIKRSSQAHPISILVSRVNQFDAARLDVEMSAMLTETVIQSFLFVEGILFQYEAELDTFLEFLIWRFSIWVDKPTPGNALMNLRYRDERSYTWKMVVQVSIHDAASQKKAVSAVSGLAGIVSIVSDIASSKLTVTGDLNPVAIIKQLKKNKCSPHLEELGPVKDEEAEAKKKKEEEEKKKKEEEEEEKKRMIWNQACNRPMIFEVMCENPSYW